MTIPSPSQPQADVTTSVDGKTGGRCGQHTDVAHEAQLWGWEKSKIQKSHGQENGSGSPRPREMTTVLLKAPWSVAAIPGTLSVGGWTGLL